MISLREQHDSPSTKTMRRFVIRCENLWFSFLNNSTHHPQRRWEGSSYGMKACDSLSWTTRLTIHKGDEKVRHTVWKLMIPLPEQLDSPSTKAMRRFVIRCEYLWFPILNNSTHHPQRRCDCPRPAALPLRVSSSLLGARDVTCHRIKTHRDSACHWGWKLTLGTDRRVSLFQPSLSLSLHIYSSLA